MPAACSLEIFCLSRRLPHDSFNVYLHWRRGRLFVITWRALADATGARVGARSSPEVQQLFYPAIERRCSYSRQPSNGGRRSTGAGTHAFASELKQEPPPMNKIAAAPRGTAGFSRGRVPCFETVLRARQCHCIQWPTGIHARLQSPKIAG